MTRYRSVQCVVVIVIVGWVCVLFHFPASRTRFEQPVAHQQLNQLESKWKSILNWIFFEVDRWSNSPKSFHFWPSDCAPAILRAISHRCCKVPECSVRLVKFASWECEEKVIRKKHSGQIDRRTYINRRLALKAAIAARAMGSLHSVISFGTFSIHSQRLSAAASSPSSHNASMLNIFAHQMVNESSQSAKRHWNDDLIFVSIDLSCWWNTYSVWVVRHSWELRW